jgi:hypothetical protein
MGLKLKTIRFSAVDADIQNLDAKHLISHSQFYLAFDPYAFLDLANIADPRQERKSVGEVLSSAEIPGNLAVDALSLNLAISLTFVCYKSPIFDRLWLRFSCVRILWHLPAMQVSDRQSGRNHSEWTQVLL